jgi:hypothetical protein
MNIKWSTFFINKVFPLVFAFFISSIFMATAQLNSGVNGQNNDELQARLIREKWNKEVGNFQIQVVNSRVKPQVNAALVEEILAKRRLDEIVYIPLMENVRIMVLSESHIKSPDFKPLELFKYIHE